MAEKREIKYTGRTFSDFKNQLVEFSKTYFPNTYNDFTAASPGMMFMEMSAYVGDVLSFYLDNQIQETFIEFARERGNVFEMAYMLGYKPKVTTAATVPVTVYQKIPAISGQPDWRYTLTLSDNSIVYAGTTNTNVKFLTQEVLDFSRSSSMSPTDVTVYEVAGSVPQSYLLKKTVNAISADIKTEVFDIGNSKQFLTLELVDSNILGILDIVDSDGNVWYEVSHLAQDSVYDSIKNTNVNNPNYSTDSNVPYLLQTKQVQRRFASRFLDQTTLQIQFGAGTTGDNDEEIVPNPNNVGLGLPQEKDKLTTAFSPTNFIFTNTYGIAPSNTQLTVRYLTGGGVSANVPAGVLNRITPSNLTFTNSDVLDSTLANNIFQSLTVVNKVAASGGSSGDSVTEVKQNALSNFQNQLRTVTADDYMLRALSLPSMYGTVAKAYAQPSMVRSSLPGEVNSSVDLYVLGFDYRKKLTTATAALKQNLKTYLSQFRIINDSVNIRDAYVVNIGVDFEVVTYPNYNNSQVLENCINTLKSYFNIDKWQINEPILLKDLFIALDKVEGVQTVKNIVISNKAGGNYSNFTYDVEGARKNNVVYPSIDPMIFEVKYPDTDIRGRVVPL